ncbi:hypothetical protein VTH82DRAFT_6237 [Thermothelomyces myriococcoides]
MSGLNARQRQHRRQNSTPSAFDVAKIAPLPNIQQRRPISHRRGLSLDTRGQPLAPAPRPDAGLSQKHNPMTIQEDDSEPARTPQRTPRSSIDHSSFIEQEARDNFLISPQVTPQSRRFTDAVSSSPHFADFSGLPFDPYSTSPGFFDRPVSRLSGNGIEPAPEFDFFNPDTALSTPSFITFPESSPGGPDHGWGSESETASTHSRRSSRRISNGIMDKFPDLEAMGGEFGASTRPCTPSSQLANDCFPQTPTAGSFKEESAPLQPPNRFTEGYDESMEETLKPIRPKKNRSSGIFQELRQQAEAMSQTPPHTDSIPMALTAQGLRTPDFMSMRNISAEFKKIEREFAGMPGSPTNAPSMAPFPRPDDDSGKKPGLPTLGAEGQNPVPQLGPPAPVSKGISRRGSPHRRAESIASITSAASIADINIEETRTETGVTLEDIAAYIQGPDPSDGKWRCLYEGCGKLFGRKENIKSHVQTHLNDRQYRCPTCKKCFVRQHDLKRHAKIHTGIKPYPCECGNSFARHDALTRHRQRGMCIGAFDGIVRKVVKRGRPKKIRPDMDERRDKAERTRRKNKLTSANSASSQSGYSDVSGANSPNNEFDGLLNEEKFQDILSSSIASLTTPISTATMNPSTLAVSAAAMPTSSGSASATTTTMAEVFQRSLSPSAMSNYSHASHASSYHHHPSNPVASDRSQTGADGDIQNPPSPAKSVSSHYSTTPPDLSSPRSPPPLLGSCNTPFFDELNDDMTHRSSCSSNNSGSTIATTSSASRDNAADAGSADGSRIGGLGSGGYHHGLAALDGQHDMLLGFHPHHSHAHGADGLVPLDGAGGGAGLKFEKLGFEGLKFEDEGFDPVSMFTSGEDVFFGTA